jgi:hypothetical protein
MRFIGAMLVAVFMMPAIAFSQTAVDLGTAANFRILAAASVTIGTGDTVLGDVGVSPTPTVTNNGTVTGTIHLNDAAAQAAMTALNTAYLDAQGQTATTTYGAIHDLGGDTLTHGVYNDPSSFGITGTLTLDGGGNANAVFIFQMGSTLTTATSSSVVLINGAQWSNVFWQVGSSATLGVSSVFEGNILANTSITVDHDVTLHGRLLAGAVTSSGAVSLDLNDNALLVQATSFKAVAHYGSVALSWQTQSELDNAGFNVLRQDAGTTYFRLISSYIGNHNLKGMGTSTSGRSYGFTDAKVQSGMTYEYKIQSVSINGTTKDLSTLSVTVDAPKNYALYQNFPNPFNPSTTIRFDLKQPSTVTLAIYNVLGQKLLEENYGTMNAGSYVKSMNMDTYSSGVYFYRIDAIGNSGSGGDGQKFVSIKKLVLMK